MSIIIGILAAFIFVKFILPVIEDSASDGIVAVMLAFLKNPFAVIGLVVLGLVLAFIGSNI